jgi:hypothetical protein
LPSAEAAAQTQNWTNSSNFPIYVFAICFGVLVMLFVFFALRRVIKSFKKKDQDSSQSQIYSIHPSCRSDEIAVQALRNDPLNREVSKRVAAYPVKSPSDFIFTRSFWELDNGISRYPVPQNNTDQPPVPPIPNFIHISENSQQLPNTIYSSMKEAKYFQQDNTDQPPFPPNPNFIHISQNSQELPTPIYSSRKEAKYFPENKTDQPPLPPNSGIIHISENSQQLPTTLDMRRKEAKYF